MSTPWHCDDTPDIQVYVNLHWPHLQVATQEHVLSLSNLVENIKLDLTFLPFVCYSTNLFSHLFSKGGGKIALRHSFLISAGCDVTHDETVKSQIYLFADDTKIYKGISNQEDSEQLQDDLNKLQMWSKKWLLKFHPNKCKVATLGKRKVTSSYHMTDDQGNLVELEEIDEEKDIGVTIDTKLSFESHIANITSKASQIMGAIRCSFQHLDNDHMMMLYKSQVRSILEYGNPVWNPYKKKDINLIENVQRKTTRNLPGMKDLSYPDRLRKPNLPTLVYRRLRGDMITTYKILHEIHDVSVCPDLPFIGETATRGNSMKIFERRPDGGTNLRKFFFTLRVPRMWNTLPREVVQSKNVRQFETALDEFWRNKPWKFDHETWNPV